MPARGPASLRPLVMALHWTAILTIAAWLFGRLPGWGLAAHAGLWAAVSLIWGLRGGPSPALPAPWRRAAHVGHAALLALYLTGAVGAALGWDVARPLLLATLVLGSLHGVFNLWRASVLGDGALRRMTPRAMW